MLMTLAPMLERQQGELQDASWRPPSLNKGVPTAQQSRVIVPQSSADRFSDFLGKLKNADFYVKLHFIDKKTFNLRESL